MNSVTKEIHLIVKEGCVLRIDLRKGICKCSNYANRKKGKKN